MENIYKQINILNDNIKNYRVKIKKSLKIKVILSASKYNVSSDQRHL